MLQQQGKKLVSHHNTPPVYKAITGFNIPTFISIYFIHASLIFVLQDDFVTHHAGEYWTDLVIYNLL